MIHSIRNVISSAALCNEKAALPHKTFESSILRLKPYKRTEYLNADFYVGKSFV